MKNQTQAFFAAFFFVLVLAQSVQSETSLESFTYNQDFETKELSAWASYPLWQDTAYDPNFHIGAMVPGDPNISIIQKVTPYTSVDNYAGTQKKLDMYMSSESTISLRYYLKTNLPVAFFKVRIAAGPDGKVDCTISDPATNRWEWVRVTYNDLIRENPGIAGKSRIKVNALAVLAKIPDADPAMPIYLGIDDVKFEGARAVQFQFDEPEVFKLSEWKPYISGKHYQRGDTFDLKGTWPLRAGRVTLTVTPFTELDNTILTRKVKKSGEMCSTQFTLSYPVGLYLATLKAYRGKEIVSDTEFTFYIAPKNIGGKHPRLWFDSEKKEWVADRLKSERFKNVADDILKQAKNAREGNPIETIVDEIDQFHTVMINNVPVSLYPWFDRINIWRKGVYNSALAYGLLGDEEAGEYGKELLLKLSAFPRLVHPWFDERGRHIYYPVGELGQEMAVAYDLLYDLMDGDERKQVRNMFMQQIVKGCHQGYVEDDIVTNNTSNWVAHITGGSLMCQAAIYGDGPDVAQVEPYFTGVIFKTHDLIQKAFGSDGSYGEGYGYYNFTMLSLSKSVPAADNVFKIDMSENIRGTYKEITWAGLIKNKRFFYFGDGGGSLGPLTNWAWLLDKHKDPLLGWLYNHLKRGETLMDVLYETGDVPRDDPFDENPVAAFMDVGTTVFKSGWEPEDFVFVMRTGAFYNHQHIDQGTFWLSDRGSLFMGERHGSTYYEDPLYQPWYTQPIAHSTILIDGNHQSQRVGDPLKMAEGFHDHAFIHHFLDGENAAFSSGDIGRLYWGNAKEMKRNVLYLKPRTILMLDTVVPAERDVDMTLLYQTEHLNALTAGDELSTITYDDNTLNIIHLHPEHPDVASVETPHYLYTLRNEKPLEREGMLTVTARTNRIPLVIANLLTTTAGEKPDVTYEQGDGFFAGEANGISFAFSTRPGVVYNAGFVQTDALAITYNDSRIFSALCTTFSFDGKLLVESSEPITCELTEKSMKYYLAEKSDVIVGVSPKPKRIIVNGKKITSFGYDADRKAVVINLPAGEGMVSY